jgi:hypothetical protein
MVVRMPDSEEGFDYKLGPKPTRREGKWLAQVLLTEATMARQLALVVTRPGQEQLTTWLAAIGGRFEAQFAFTIFDDSLQMMVLRLAWQKKPRNAIAKHLAKFDESKKESGVIQIATGLPAK